jgi:prepilin-type N-terminal cleavage/methylation domain-containing protein
MAARENARVRRGRADRHAARRGMTLLELSISTVVLAFLVFTAATVAKVALDATGEVVVADADAGKERRTDDRLEELLLSASLATLQGVPNQGQVAEFMQEDVVYQDLRFRRVVGFVDGARVYEPALTESAARLYRSTTRSGTGSLVLEDGGTTTTLLEDVTALSVRLDGTKLTVSIDHGHHESVTDVHDLVLRVP